MGVIVVSGATGLLGKTLIFKIVESKQNVKVLAIVRPNSMDKAIEMFSGLTVKCLTLDEWTALDCGGEGYLFHCAFSRSEDPLDLANSFNYTNRIFDIAIKKNINIINISSQSVYGQAHEPLWREDMAVAPLTPYALTKYATEVLLAAKASQSIKYTNIRLSSIMMTSRFPYKFILKIRSGEDIIIYGGTQKVSFLDIRDAAEALLKIYLAAATRWESVYNLGSQMQYSIIDIARLCNDIVRERGGSFNAKIIVEESNITLNSGVDSSLFYRDFNWKPRYSLRETLNVLYE